MVDYAGPIVESLVKNLQVDRRWKPVPIDMRSPLGVEQVKKEWIYYFDIGDLMTLNPISIKDLKQKYNLD